MNMDDLSALKITKKSGQERFKESGGELPQSLMDFWRWSVSDLVSNATRGRLAEFIVAMALGADLEGVRDEWQAYDLILPDKTAVEVKSAAYIQSWSQKKLSLISFSIKKSLAWDRDTKLQSKVASRQAQFYVFALLAFDGPKSGIDPMDLDQWKFYVVPTAKFDARQRSQHSITLASLEREELAKPVTFRELKAEFDRIRAANKGGMA